MVLKVTLYVLAFLLKLAKTINLLPISYTWTETQGKWIIEAKIAKEIYLRVSILQWFFNTVKSLAVIQFIFFGTRNSSIVSLFIGSIFTLINGASVPMTMAAVGDSLHEFCQAINAVMEFGRRSKNSHSKIEIFQELTVTIVTLSVLLVIIPVLTLVTFIFPCEQFSSGAFAVVFPSSCSSFLFQTLSYFCETLMLTSTVIIAGIEAIIFITGVTSVISQLKHLKHTMIGSRIPLKNILKSYKNCQLF